MLLIYQNPATWETFSEEERDRVMNEVGQIMEELTQSGEWIGGGGLGRPPENKKNRGRDRSPAGPHRPPAQSQEQTGAPPLLPSGNPARGAGKGARPPP